MSSFARKTSLAGRSAKNYFSKKSYCISFEVTYRCNARCKHCHLGRAEGKVEERRAAPQRYGELCRELKPVVAQISGGEPLLRRDLEQIVEALKQPDRAPYIVLTTNGILLTKEKYLSLLEAGVDEFSLSLDYPDERHDDFRGVPGLFKKIETLVKETSSENGSAITLSCVIQDDNFRDLIRIAELSREWKVRMNFSTYTPLRTNNSAYMVAKDELPEFRAVIDQLLRFKRKHKNIYTSDYALKKTIEFFDKTSIPRCRAGERFIVVNPDGTLSPCGLIIQNYRSQKDIKQKFLKTNDCGLCYTAIRANAEKPTWYLIKDSLKAVR